MTHILIVGQGLAGLFAANVAALKGLQVTLVAEGRGGLSQSHGCLDLGRTQMWPLSDHSLSPALALFLEVVASQGLRFAGDDTAALRLPTAAGTTRATQYAPDSLARGDLQEARPTWIASFAGFRDFDAGVVVRGLRDSGLEAQVVMLPLPSPATRDLYSSDLALRFEHGWSPEQLASIWGPMLVGAPRLGLPAVLGLDRASEIHRRLEQLLGIEIFEIPTLPPSVPGLRIERALRRHALQLGCRVAEGPHVIGRIDGRFGGSRVIGVVAETGAGPRAFDADAVLLATGSFLHGGLRASRGGSVVDSVFGLPIHAAPDREQWLGDRCLAAHPYDLMGLKVNERLQPVDPRGVPYYSNVFACGGVLGGIDRRGEHCRQGIDLATAFEAVGSVAA